MIFPSLPISILYRITMVLPPDYVSSFAVNNDQFLFKCTKLILNVSILPSLYSYISSISSSYTALLLQYTFLKCLVLPHPADILLYTRHCLGACNLPQYLHGCHCVAGSGGCLVLSSFAFFMLCTLSNCLNSVMIFNTAAWTLCASTLLAQASTLSLVIWSSVFVVVSSFMISSSIQLSFSP